MERRSNDTNGEESASQIDSAKKEKKKEEKEVLRGNLASG